jgi:hypothetical protein
VITGFNTDVKHKNRVFHIQTEDKGEANPFVESLVYVGGEILATKRTSYAEVMRDGADEHAVQDLMEQQHRTMIAAIQRGRFDGPNGSLQIPDGMSPTAGPMPASASSSVAAAAGTEAAAVPESDPTTPAAASPIQGDRSLDQLVLDYLASGEMPEDVEVAFSPKAEFVSGRSFQSKLKATSGSPARPLSGAAVQVRIVSTSARSSTAFQGRTGADGACAISFMVPSFPNGNAAVVVRVTGPSAGTEVQFPIKKK